MSISLLNDVPWQCGHFTLFGSAASASDVYQASAPARANSFSTSRFTAGSISGLPQVAHKNTAIGTPQIRCREMHQSGRVAIMFEMRPSPQAGSHLTLLISSSARERKVPHAIGVSIEMNHCSVARKMIGLWQRQQCGYECSIFSVC